MPQLERFGILAATLAVLAGCQLTTPSVVPTSSHPSPEPTPIRDEVPVGSPQPTPTRTPGETSPPSPTGPDDPVPLAGQVALADVASIAAAEDGTLYICSAYDGRVWRLKPDGAVSLAAGNGFKPTEDVAGRLATAVGLASPNAVAVDRQGRLLILEGNRLTRLNADGTLTTLVPKLDNGYFVMAGEGDQVLYVQGYTWDTRARLYAVKPGEGPKLLCELDFGAQTYMWACGRDAQGRILGWLTKRGSSGVDAAASGVFVIDPQSGKLTRLPGVPANAHVDPAGQVLAVQNGQVMRYVDGRAEPVGQLGPLEADRITYDPRTKGAFVSTHFQVHQLSAQGPAKAVAGLPRFAPVDLPARGFGFSDPGGLAVGADGTVYAADASLGRIFKFTRQERVVGDRAHTGLPSIGVLRTDPQGNLYAIERRGLGLTKLTPDGRRSAIATPYSDLVDLVVAAEGELYLSAQPMGQERVNKVSRVRDGRETLILNESQGGGYGNCYGLGLAPDGALLIVGRGKLQRWTERDGLELLAEHATLTLRYAGEASPGIAVDASGRVVVGDGDGQLVRFDPKTKQATALVGPGGLAYQGESVDESVLRPGAPAFAPDGSLVLMDAGARRLKRIPASAL